MSLEAALKMLCLSTFPWRQKASALPGLEESLLCQGCFALSDRLRAQGAAAAPERGLQSDTTPAASAIQQGLQSVRGELGERADKESGSPAA